MLEEGAWEQINKYKNMKIGRGTIPCPYYMNVAKRSVMSMLREVQVPEDAIDKFSSLWRMGKTGFGRHQGKGTPEEIIEATREITGRIGLPVDRAYPEIVVEIMKHIGLGIDCSGLVFNVLSFAFDKEGRNEELLNCLDWSEPDKRSASRAGVTVFAGKASETIDPSEARSLDLILTKGTSGKYNHIALILQKADGDYDVVQSTLLALPTGVNVSGMIIVNGKPEFGYKPGVGTTWEEKYAGGTLEFRRLAVLSH